MTCQSRLYSFVEVAVDAIIGYTVSILAQLVVYPMFGIHVSMSSSLLIGLIFSAIGMTTAYLTRRIFNYYNSTRKV